jgi:hypothetical protein
MKKHLFVVFPLIAIFLAGCATPESSAESLPATSSKDGTSSGKTSTSSNTGISSTGTSTSSKTGTSTSSETTGSTSAPIYYPTVYLSPESEELKTLVGGIKQTIVIGKHSFFFDRAIVGTISYNTMVNSSATLTTEPALTAISLTSPKSSVGCSLSDFPLNNITVTVADVSFSSGYYVTPALSFFNSNGGLISSFNAYKSWATAEDKGICYAHLSYENFTIPENAASWALVNSFRMDKSTNVVSTNTGLPLPILLMIINDF